MTTIGITGTTSAATMYIAAFLSQCGLDVGHEYMGRDGISDWKLAAELNDDRLIVEYDHFRILGYVKRSDNPCSGRRIDVFLHQVRHPLRVITSHARFPDDPQAPIWHAISQHVPLSPADPPLVRSMKFWLYWNEMAEEKADYTYCVEDLRRDSETFDVICALTGAQCPDGFPFVPRNTNTRRHIRPAHRVTWDDLEEASNDLVWQVTEAAVRYGYRI